MVGVADGAHEYTLHGVGEQVFQHVAQPVPIALDGEFVRCPHHHLPILRLQGGHRVTDQRDEIKQARVAREHPLFSPRRIHQIIDHVFQPRRGAARSRRLRAH